MTPLPRGYCPVCGKALALRKDGTVFLHFPPFPVYNEAGRPLTCGGSGRAGLDSAAEAARVSARLLTERAS